MKACSCVTYARAGSDLADCLFDGMVLRRSPTYTCACVEVRKLMGMPHEP
jgi:hypothetical protein